MDVNDYEEAAWGFQIAHFMSSPWLTKVRTDLEVKPIIVSLFSRELSDAEFFSRFIVHESILDGFYATFGDFASSSQAFLLLNLSEHIRHLQRLIPKARVFLVFILAHCFL